MFVYQVNDEDDGVDIKSHRTVIPTTPHTTSHSTLSTTQDTLDGRLGHAIHLVHRLQAWILQQAQARNAKAGVPDIHHVTRPVRDAALLRVLRAQDEVGKLLLVDPVRLANYFQTAQHPPAVAHVLLLLRTAVQATAGDLPLTQPATQAVNINELLAASDGEGSDAGEDLTRVGLGTRANAVAAVKVGACSNVVNSLVNIDKVEEAKEGKGIEGAVEEASVFLTPLVTGKRASLTVLEAGDVWRLIVSMCRGGLPG